MAEITATLVKTLRERTDAGMMDCKKALVECDGDMEAAVKFLREKGIAKAAAKAGREAREGAVAAVVSGCGCDGILFELNCETDFCAKGEKFRTLVSEVGTALKASGASGLEEALRVTMSPEGSVEEHIKAECSSIGENMKLSKFARLSVEGPGVIASYIHMGGKVGVLLSVACGNAATKDAPAFRTLVKDLTLHIAAASPKSVDSSSLDPAFVAEEQEIAKAQLLQEGKPEHLLEKILPGKLHALYKQSCLLDQDFVKNPSISVGKLVAEAGRGIGDSITVTAFQRFQLGA
ncbi:MAG: translation elongation factor Ts [Akkermansiaceae bacterium]|nr:translation elongation factor Ts [Akkermansiaceae bacterium]